MGSRARAVWPLLVLLLLALAAPAAQAQSFGTNLSRPVNNTFATCFNGYDEGPFAPYHFQPRQNSCTWASVGGLGNTAESHVAPATGVITGVNIKVGPTTGPMQFTLLRYYRRDNPADPGHPDLRGPFWAGESQVFTPRAGPANTGAVQRIPVRLAVRSEFDPTLGVYVFDSLGLSVLAPNVPIPAHDTGDRSGNFLSAAWFPRVSAADQANGRVDGHPPAGVVPLYNATVNCAAAAGSRARASQCAGGQVELRPSTALARSSAAVRGRLALLRLTCKLSKSCKGKVRLLRTVKGSAKKKPATYGSGRFSIKPGKTKTVKAKLSKAGRRLMRKRKKAKVSVAITTGKGKAAKVFTTRVTLKRAARKKR